MEGHVIQRCDRKDNARIPCSKLGSLYWEKSKSVGLCTDQIRVKEKNVLLDLASLRDCSTRIDMAIGSGIDITVKRQL